MKKSNQKLKLLYLALIFAEKTDEEHTITVPEIIRELEKYDISAERKSLYDDLECLKLFGYDICSVKSRTTGYYLASRDFELPELKLLVDSVQSSKFITSKKSMELISKIEKLTSKECAKKLHRQVYVTNRVKTLNEQIYYNVDRIHDAIVAGKQITFRYFNYDLSKNKVYKKQTWTEFLKIRILILLSIQRKCFRCLVEKKPAFPWSFQMILLVLCTINSALIFPW